MFMDFIEKVQKIWNVEIFFIDQNPVTIQEVVIALLIFILGVLIVKYVIRLLREKFLRIHLKQTTAEVIERVLYYLGLLLVVLLVLRYLNIPLTALAFLGGAIAIGVGFGAQTLINNFISGFIIMVEKPIKIGDMVEVEGTFAIVEEIGARCTRMRTGANVHILVPNSSFLEKNIINWTLSDEMIRAHVTIGVVYGSPVREVERLLIIVAKEHEKVLEDPEPFVLFNDFGDNALVFEINFWISMTHLLDRRIIASDVRFRTDELFRESGIVIAFPQRDVHLDTTKPLEVEIRGSKKSIV
jgi:potassium efflux system protein